MIKNRRVEKVSSLLKKEISLIINYELEDDLISGNFVAITNIELTLDLQFCKIFVSTSASEELKLQIIEQLNSKKNTIRHFLSKRLSMKRIPDLIFKKDKVFDEGIAVLKVLDELRLNNSNQKESMNEKNGKY
tara:strand:- start:1299 stop:1697 length:399 start_codon:yes stop_codon:yes gene_type:complete